MLEWKFFTLWPEATARRSPWAWKAIDAIGRSAGGNIILFYFILSAGRNIIGNSDVLDLIRKKTSLYKKKNRHNAEK